MNVEERLELLEKTQAELMRRMDAILTRAEALIERIEKEGPAALLGGMLGRRKRGG